MGRSVSSPLLSFGDAVVLVPVTGVVGESWCLYCREKKAMWRAGHVTSGHNLLRAQQP